MAILDPTVQIKLAKMFDLMWDDFCEGATEELEAWMDASGLTEEFELTQDMIDASPEDYAENDPGDVMRRLTDDGEAVIRLADEARRQARESSKE